MGGICSRSRRSTVDDGNVDNAAGVNFSHANGHSNNGAGMDFQSRALPEKILSHDPSPVGEVVDKQLREPNVVSYGLHPDDINDGIPHLSRVLSNKSRSNKSKQAAVVKVILNSIVLCMFLLYGFLGIDNTSFGLNNVWYDRLLYARLFYICLSSVAFETRLFYWKESITRNQTHQKEDSNMLQ